MPPSAVTLGAVNIEARDVATLSRFWAGVIGAEQPAPGETVYLPPSGPGSFAMFFQPLGDAVAGRQTIHLDLTVPWGSRRSEVDRIIALGAEHRWDVLDEVPHVQWTTLADPEGHLFCVAEHPPT